MNLTDAAGKAPEGMQQADIDKCEQWRAHFMAVIGANASGMFNSGCTCQRCTRAKAGGAAAAMLYYAVRFTVACNMDRNREEHIAGFDREIMAAFVDKALADLAEEAMAEKATAPTTETPQ